LFVPLTKYFHALPVQIIAPERSLKGDVTVAAVSFHPTALLWPATKTTFATVDAGIWSSTKSSRQTIKVPNQEISSRLPNIALSSVDCGKSIVMRTLHHPRPVSDIDGLTALKAWFPFQR
jgi:hypothetical protein